MSTLSDQYRQMAAQARSDADAAELPNVQQRHLRSAERLDHIAQEIENVAKAKARNDAAKEAEAGAHIATGQSVRAEAGSASEQK